ncbi:hypothetical protein BDR03DRAFT_986556 [Suillus americanus]|nr:hypothetical protein BDR03DRAFT_986556 [Suillus americanus]
MIPGWTGSILQTLQLTSYVIDIKVETSFRVWNQTQCSTSKYESIVVTSGGMNEITMLEHTYGLGLGMDVDCWTLVAQLKRILWLLMCSTPEFLSELENMMQGEYKLSAYQVAPDAKGQEHTRTIHMCMRRHMEIATNGLHEILGAAFDLLDCPAAILNGNLVHNNNTMECKERVKTKSKSVWRLIHLAWALQREHRQFGLAEEERGEKQESCVWHVIELCHLSSEALDVVHYNVPSDHTAIHLHIYILDIQPPHVIHKGMAKLMVWCRISGKRQVLGRHQIVLEWQIASSPDHKRLKYDEHDDTESYTHSEDYSTEHDTHDLQDDEQFYVVQFQKDLMDHQATAIERLNAHADCQKREIEECKLGMAEVSQGEVLNANLFVVSWLTEWLRMSW